MEEALQDLKRQHRKRELRSLETTGGIIRSGGRQWVNLASNDYLNLANNPIVKAKAVGFVERYGVGATASRLVTGNLGIVEELEQRLATLKGAQASLVFGSGFLANVGLIPALVGRDDTILADRLSHASLLDGCILSRATLERFPHNDMNQLEELLQKTGGKGKRLIVTESVFSMDGDRAPLSELVGLAMEHDAMLLVDEAHATGVLGPKGAGLLSGVKAMKQGGQYVVGTLSKALAGYGGFVACTATARDFVINRARSFIYSTGLPPAVIGAALGALDVLAGSPGMGDELLRRAELFRALLKAGGQDVGRSDSQIVPLMIGDDERALRIAARLREKGIIAVAIRPPTVPPGTARIRFSITLAHSDECLEEAAKVILTALDKEGP